MGGLCAVRVLTLSSIHIRTQARLYVCACGWPSPHQSQDPPQACTHLAFPQYFFLSPAQITCCTPKPTPFITPKPRPSPRLARTAVCVPCFRGLRACFCICARSASCVCVCVCVCLASGGCLPASASARGQLPVCCVCVCVCVCACAALHSQNCKSMV